MQVKMGEEPEFEMLIQVHKAGIALRDRDSTELKKISDLSITEASVFQEEESVSLAIIFYALSKIVDRTPKETEYQSAKLDRIINRLEKIEVLLKNDRREEIKRDIREIFEIIQEMDDKIPMYIQEIIEKARVTKGTKIHEQGIALGRAAELLGISQWSLMRYVGNTVMHDKEEPAKISVMQRIKFAKSLFNI